MQKPMHEGANAKLFSFAKEMRKEPTFEEYKLWNSLRGRKFEGYKFRRQHPVQNYIADFYCHTARLIIEVDGGIHNRPDQIEYDDHRTRELNASGIRVIRFTNEDVRNNFSMVLGKILANLKSLPNQAHDVEE